MKKKILVGTALVFVVLLLTPSVSAIQMKTIEDITYDDIQEKLNDFVNQILQEKNILDDIKHPFLYEIVSLFFILRTEIGFNLLSKSSYLGYDGVVIVKPIIFIYGMWLFTSAFFWLAFWANISISLGWEWKLPPPGWDFPYFPLIKSLIADC